MQTVEKKQTGFPYMLNLRFSSLLAAKVTIFRQKTACFESFNVISSTESLNLTPNLFF